MIVPKVVPYGMMNFDLITKAVLVLKSVRNSQVEQLDMFAQFVW